MSIQHVGWVLANSEATGSERLVLLALANRVNDDHGGWCWPSIELMGREARLSESATRRAMQRLVAEGRLEVQAGGGRRPNRYRLVMDTEHELELAGEPQLSPGVSSRQGCQIDTPALAPTRPQGSRPRDPNRKEPKENNPPTPAERGNKRARGVNPRALGTSPRQLATADLLPAFGDDRGTFLPGSGWVK